MTKYPRVQVTQVKPFEYNAVDRVNTEITITLSRPLNKATDKLLLTLSNNTTIEGIPIGKYWVDDSSTGEDSTSDEEDYAHLVRMFRFYLEDLPINASLKYTVTCSINNRAPHVLRYKNNYQNQVKQFVKNVSLKTPRYEKEQRASTYHLIAGGDQEVIPVSLSGDSAGSDELITFRDDNRKLTHLIYQRIASRQPDSFAHLGDAFHGEGPTFKQVKQYWEFLGHLEEDYRCTVRGSLQSVPATRILDDHDLGKNEANPSDFDENDDKNPVNIATQVFNQMWPVPKHSGRTQQHGLYYKTVYGDVHSFHLHNRIYKDGYSLLGKTQYDWLENELLSIKKGIKFIFMPLPFVMGKNPNEDHRAKPKSWTKLLKLFARTGVNAIFTADSHNYSRSDIEVTVDGAKVIIPQFLSGLFGGVAQAPGDDEYDSMKESGLAIVPARQNDIKGYVRSYYGPARSYAYKSFRLIHGGSSSDHAPYPLRGSRGIGYLEVMLSEGHDKERRMDIEFHVVPKGTRYGHFYKLDSARYMLSDANLYRSSRWPADWRELEIESKWDISAKSYLAMIKNLPHKGTCCGYDLEVRWGKGPKVFVDHYYDQAGRLMDRMFSLRHRTQYLRPDGWLEQHKGKYGTKQIFATFDPERWEQNWQRIQFKEEPLRERAVWFRRETGEGRVYDKDGEDLSVGFEHNDKEAYLKALSGEIEQSAVKRLKDRMPTIDSINPDRDTVYTVTDFRYRILFLENDVKLYEMSLDHVCIYNHLDRTTKYSFEAELEMQDAAKQKGREGLLGLFRLADKIAFKFKLKPSMKTKGNVLVPVVDEQEFSVERSSSLSNNALRVHRNGMMEEGDDDDIYLKRGRFAEAAGA